MSNRTSQPLCLRAFGPLACFTRPELKAERMSYAVPTPSAARGLFEAILWKPAIQWHVTGIRVLKPVQFTAFRRNEVNSKAVAPARNVMINGGDIRPFFIEDDRAQRNTVALRDVDYLFEACFSMTARAGAEDNEQKFVEMFQRRLTKGQHFSQPYFGCREFAAAVEPADNSPEPIPEDRDLGLMLWDIEYDERGNRPRFFHATMKQGVIDIPLELESFPGSSDSPDAKSKKKPASKKQAKGAAV